MIWLALLVAAQAPPPWVEDVLAGEVQDFRGRRDACEYTLHKQNEWRLWDCSELGQEAAALRSKLKSRPDLVARLDTRLDAKEKHLIFSGDERHSAVIQRIVQEGTVRNARKVTVAAEANADRLDRISVQVAGQQPILVRISELIEYPDLRSTRVLWHGEAIQVELDFGVPRPWCFTNSDGRSELTIIIDGSRAHAVRQDTVKCSLMSRDVSITGYPAAKETRP